jgi:hypothetical protein
LVGLLYTTYKVDDSDGFNVENLSKQLRKSFESRNDLRLLKKKSQQNYLSPTLLTRKGICSSGNANAICFNYSTVESFLEDSEENITLKLQVKRGLILDIKDFLRRNFKL